MADPALASALASIAGAMANAQDRWWIIGSAAVALHGGDPGKIADIDVMVSLRDLDALYQRLPLTDTPDDGKAIFRSQRFGLWPAPAMPVEFMAGLEVLKDGQWLAVSPQTRESVPCGGVDVFVPARAELIAILELFGRSKDLARAATLK
ncbi:hypothetical protein [Altererythrobacter sp. BO-6]|uniref:hypothetical protein n=1 Tax=Altererythrobacter sp. BO-6 TaxID=2604537 RepID=UPI0019D21ADA|nr:hypothetical protein [Altererythrobacter sp. BO-6]